jgi:Family of unknown function (DUF6603)
MSEEGDLSSWLIDQLINILKPLETTLQDPDEFSVLLNDHGWEIPVNIDVIQEIQNLFPNGDFSELERILAELIEEDAANTAKIMELYSSAFEILQSIVAKVHQLTTDKPNLTGQVPFNIIEFWTEFPRELLDDLIIKYIQRYHPIISGVLLFLGIIDENLRVMTDVQGRINYTRRIVRWNLLKDILDPIALIRQTYGWGSDQLNYNLLLNRLQYFLNSVGFGAHFARPTEELLSNYYDDSNPDRLKVRELRIPILGDDRHRLDSSEFVLLLSLLPITPKGERSAKPNGFSISPTITGTFKPNELSPLELKLRGGFESDHDMTLEIRPQSIIHHDPNSTIIDSEISFATNSNDQPFFAIGSDKSSGIRVMGFGIRLITKGEVDKYEISFILDIKRAEVIIETSNLNPVIAPLLGSEPLRIEIKDFSLIWSSKSGVHFSGNAGLKMIVSIGQSINGATLNILTLELKASPDNGIVASIGVTGSAKFGPVLISIENLSMAISLEPVQTNQPPGVFADLDFDIDFMPPTGLGIAINASGVKGGGFIARTENQYSGVIDLDLHGYSVHALVIVKTEPSVSLFFAIFSEFRTPIQVGAGWKITRIGGMLGINHTVSHNKIATGIKSGVLDKILFPDDIIKNAPTVISNFETVFPVLHEQYIFGPAIQIAYGTPTLIAGDVAVILEFPNPFLLSVFGKVTSKLPNKDNPIVQINVGIVGALDIVNGKVEVYGSIYDSKILDFALSGDMAMAASWGSEKSFIFSIGGFNPGFNPPSNFPPFNAPPLKRLNLAFSSHVTFECYLALTSNTLQIGARVDARFEVGATISGFMSFDALVQFNPLYYVINVAAGFSVKLGKRSLASIAFLGFIEGPNPHRISGSVTFSILWWDISLDVDKTYGEQQPDIILSVDPWDVLSEALKQDDSWTTELPERQAIGVVIKESLAAVTQDGDGDTSGVREQLIHPSGRFKVSQTVVPLNHRLTKFGSADPKDHFKFEIKDILLNDITADASGLLHPTQDYFAPGQFTEFPESKMLNLKSYELMDSGVFYTADQKEEVDFQFDSRSTKEIKYETCLVENIEEECTPITDLPAQSATLSQSLILAGISYHTALSNSNRLRYHLKYHVPDATLENEKFVIVNEDDNTEVEISKHESSMSVALTKLAEHRKANPQDKRNLIVISAFESPGEVPMLA